MSKKSWVKLLKFCNFGSLQEKEAKLNRLFFTHHQNCDEFIHMKTGEPLVAVYFHPEALHRIELKALMADIKKRVLYANELDEI